MTIAVGTMAWIMSAQGVIHRGQYQGPILIALKGRPGQVWRHAWGVACRATPLADPKLKVMERRPRDAMMCKRCARALGAPPVSSKQTALAFT